MGSDYSSVAYKDSGHLQYVFVTIGVTAFLAWAGQELLERKCGMAPVIRRTKSIAKQAKRSSTPEAALAMAKRLTKKLDKSGKYRIQTRGTVYYVKAVWAFCFFIASILLFALSDFYYQHFIELNRNSVYYPLYQHIAGSMAAIYLWEVATNRYAKIDVSVLVHHWFTIIISISILLGNFSPFATWYGISSVSLAFPILLGLGFRVIASKKYPEFARGAMKFCAYWYVLLVLLNFGGQIYLAVHGLQTGKIHIASIIVIFIAICGWAWDDYYLMKALLEFSTQPYEANEAWKVSPTHTFTKRFFSARNLKIADAGEEEEEAPRLQLPGSDSETGAAYAKSRAVHFGVPRITSFDVTPMGSDPSFAEAMRSLTATNTKANARVVVEVHTPDAGADEQGKESKDQEQYFNTEMADRKKPAETENEDAKIVVVVQKPDDQGKESKDNQKGNDQKQDTGEKAEDGK